jgi:biotin carboxyl carrier protein
MSAQHLMKDRGWEGRWLIVAALGALAALMLVARAAGAGETSTPERPAEVVSPLDGVYCAGGWRGDAPYVTVGSRVTPSTVVARIDPLYGAGSQPSVFVPAGVHGVVVEIVVADGDIVRGGQLLLKIQVDPPEPAVGLSD